MYNNQNTGYNPNGYPQNGQNRQRKAKINQWEGEGIIRPKSTNEQDPIKYWPSKTGNGGAIYATLKCTELTGQTDQNGQPKTTTAFVPITIWTNKNITPQMLQSLVPGMKVRVVGKLKNESYENKTTHQRVSSMVVNVFVLEILEMPMQAPAYGSAGQYGMQMPPMQGYQQQQPQAPMSGQQGGYIQQQPQGQVPPYYQPQQNPYPPMPAQAVMPQQGEYHQTNYRQAPQYNQQQERKPITNEDLPE